MKRGRKANTCVLIKDDAPQAAIDVAAKRTLPHVANLQMVDFDLRQFAVNCYMQGLNDAFQTCLERKLFADALLDGLPQPTEPLEYCI